MQFFNYNVHAYVNLKRKERLYIIPMFLWQFLMRFHTVLVKYSFNENKINEVCCTYHKQNIKNDEENSSKRSTTTLFTHFTESNEIQLKFVRFFSGGRKEDKHYNRTQLSLYTPVIPRKRTRSATINAERGKSSNTGRWIFLHKFRQNDYQSLKKLIHLLKVNVCLAFQQNPDFKWYRER